MIKKYLGKITNAEYGTVSDYPFLMGLQLDFKFDDSMHISAGCSYTVNMSPECKWETCDRKETIVKYVDELYTLLKDAKCNYVSELKDKPVEITFDGNCFKDFRILTEVL